MKKKEHGKDEEIPILNMNDLTFISDVGHVHAPRNSGFLFNCVTSDSYKIS